MKLRIAGLIALAGLSLVGCDSTGAQTPPQAAGQAAPTPASSSLAAVSSDPLQNKGIGPITSLTLEPVDHELAESGEKIFKGKCTACHRIEKRRVGPALGGVTERRTPEWIMNLLMNTPEMLKKDPVAQELLAEYSTQMADLKLSEADARALLEYLRTKTGSEVSSRDGKEK